MNQFSELILTKIDVLSGFESIKLCIGYTLNGKPFNQVPADIENFRQLVPVYETLPGWGSLPEQLQVDELPQPLLNFIQKIEKVVGTKVSLISYGPDRNQTLQIK